MIIANFTSRIEFKFLNVPLVRVLITILFFFLMSDRPFAQESATTPANVEQKKLTDPDQDLLNSMSLERKVGQLFVFGFSGTEFNTQLKSLIKEFQPGAIIAFKRNVKSLDQIARLNRQAQEYSQKITGSQLLTMIDQEGGVVSRIKTNPPLPSALAVGAAASTELAEKLGARLGDLLRTVGFNMNLAPVLDLSDSSKKSFIGNRAYSGDPEIVANMVLAFSKGLSSSQVIPTAKHFPGHGGVSQDSHKNTPSKLSSIEELEKTDLVPFQKFADLKLTKAMMVAHVSLPNVDPSGMPAAFSEGLVHDLLRGKMRYDGLVVTDDIEMLGANIAGTFEERAIKAIQVGCDLVMVAWSPRRQSRAIHAVIKAVKSGEIPMARIDQSVLRILRAKRSLAVNKSRELSPQKALAELGKVTQELIDMNMKRSSASIETSWMPLAPEKNLLIMSSDWDFMASLSGSGLPNKLTSVYLHRNNISNLEKLVSQGSDSVVIYFASGTITLRSVEALPKEQKRNIVLINGTYPGAIENPSDYSLVINLNSPNPESGKWVGELLKKGITQPRKPAASTPPSSADLGDDLEINEMFFDD